MDMLKTTFALAVGCIAMGLGTTASWAQPQAAPPLTAKEVMLKQVVGVEKQLTAIATEMPDEKYEFVPKDGAFRGVRSFARQVKHAAAVHYLVAATILGEPVTSDMADERGPDSVKTKAEVLQYLADSFVALKRAVDTLTNENAFTPIKGAFGSAPDTRVGLIGVAISHTSNHYGQVVEYLRMNGLTPPRTQ
jgi:uncharacterized damage-inducible protein DinB